VSTTDDLTLWYKQPAGDGPKMASLCSTRGPVGRTASGEGRAASGPPERSPLERPEDGVVVFDTEAGKAYRIT